MGYKKMANLLKRVLSCNVNLPKDLKQDIDKELDEFDIKNRTIMITN
jgi:hypothetical protein